MIILIIFFQPLDEVTNNENHNNNNNNNLHINNNYNNVEDKKEDISTDVVKLETVKTDFSERDTENLIIVFLFIKSIIKDSLKIRFLDKEVKVYFSIR